MSYKYMVISSLAAWVFTSSAYAANPVMPKDISVMKVEANAIEQENSVTIIPTEQAYKPIDAADLLTSTAGANVNKNGPTTGIVQYRGMYGSRVNVQVNGLNIAPAGPNWMDPPLSHVAPLQLESIKVIRGISPVSAGAESIGGTVQAKTVSLPYANGNKSITKGSLYGGYDSNNKAWNTGVQLGMGNQRNRLQLDGNFANGQDMKAGNGQYIVPTQYKRRDMGLEYGHLFSQGEGKIAYSNERVDNSGSPALPMDIIYVKGNAYTVSYKSDPKRGGIQWLADMHYMNTDHKMDNYSLRQRPLMLGMMNRPMYRYAVTNAKDFAYKLHVSLPMTRGRLTVGTDGWIVKHHADVYDPTNAKFYLQNYNNVKRKRYSIFSEWNTALSANSQLRAGVRYSRVNMNSGTVTATGFGGMLGTQINTLANRFNQSQLAQHDNLLDLTMQLTQRINDDLSFTFGVARKQRAPAYQERYLWSPLESTAGLADTRTYVGNVNLNPETSYNMDAGFDWHTERAYFTPHVFYKRVNNYIQGTALTSGTAYNFRVAQGNMLRGNSFCTANPLNPFCVPLQFSNVKATFYGGDAGFGINMNEHIALNGTISYVLGKRRDIQDNLYRMAPLNSTVALSYYGDSSWSITTEGVFYAKQNKVSVSNSEKATAGYSLFNMSARYAVNRDSEVSMGVNNVLDRFYQAHLSGYNRVSANAAGQASAVPAGARMPGEGRSFFVQARTRF
ncbi:MAG: TonB-dependent receptor [Zetaproteobacteria bacterium]|nr:TonB-dependent receptor [Zetaproteobacteria bacterium]